LADIAIHRLVKMFGAEPAVNDISLHVADREFLVLLGPSGCGKSTLLRLIAGLETPTSGELFIGGSLMNLVPPKERDIAMVFQNYALYPHMTVNKNITLGLRLRRTPPTTIKSRLGRAAEWLELAELLNRAPRQLSGGQQQRVALGRAVVREPKVFLMDEPLSNLDARLRVNMRAELVKLHRRLGTTIVYVTHDQIEAMTMATRVAVMRSGIIQQYAPPLDIYRRPVNKYVATFVGTPEMNMLPAVVRRNGETWDVVGAGIQLSLPQTWQPSEAIGTDHEVWVGVRPEEISILPNDDEMPGLPALIDVVSPIGGTTLVYALAGHATIVAEVPSGLSPAAGDRIRLAFNPTGVHVFDRQSELAICGCRA